MTKLLKLHDEACPGHSNDRRCRTDSHGRPRRSKRGARHWPCTWSTAISMKRIWRGLISQAGVRRQHQWHRFEVVI